MFSNFRRSLVSVVGIAAYGVVATGPAIAGTMQVYDPNTGYDPNNPHGYNYWHVEMGKRHEAVGMIDIYTTEKFTYTGFGSGTVIVDGNGDGSSMWVLTAAHVVDTATLMSISFPGEEEYVNSGGAWFRQTEYQTYWADKWYVPTSWSGFEDDAFVGNDIALIKLQREVEGVTPYELADPNWTPDLDNGGEEFEIVGFGLTGDGRSGSQYYTGHRRAGVNKLDSAFGSLLISDFDPQQGAEGGIYESLRLNPELDFPVVMEYQIAGGDSGGPDLIHDRIIGVHSFGLGLDGVADSSYLDWAGSVNVVAWLDWIEDVISGDTSGSLVGELGVPILTGGGGGTLAEQRQAYADALLAQLVTHGIIDISQLSSTEDLLRANPAADGYFLGLADAGGPVPEPTSLALLGAASLVLLRGGRRPC